MISFLSARHSEYSFIGYLLDAQTVIEYVTSINENEKDSS